MAAVYRKNVAFKRAKEAELAQKKALRDLAEMRECTFKPRIKKSFLARGGAPSYNMEDEVRMPARLRHLHIPSLQTRNEGAGRGEGGDGGGGSGSGGGGGDGGSVLGGIAEAFAQLEVDLNQRHYVVKALEKENKRLRFVSAFARADVPSAQQHLGGDFRWHTAKAARAQQRPRRAGDRSGGGAVGRGGEMERRRQAGMQQHPRHQQQRVGHSSTGGDAGGHDDAAAVATTAEDEEEEQEEVDRLQAEAHELVGGLADYVRHSTTYVTSLLWEFDQLSYLLEADEATGAAAVPPGSLEGDGWDRPRTPTQREFLRSYVASYASP